MASGHRRVVVPILSGGSVALVAATTAVVALSHPSETPRGRAAAEVKLTSAPSVEELLVRAAHRHLPSVGDLREFVAVNGVERLTPSEISGADGVYAKFAGDGNIEFKIFVGREAYRQDGASFCPQASITVPICTESQTATGHVVDEVRVTRRAPAQYGDNVFVVIGDSEKLSVADYPDLRLEHLSEVHRSDGSITRVTQTVYGPRSLDPNASFQESDMSLQSLSTDARISWTALGAPAD